MRTRPSLAVAVGTASLVLVGGIAYAAVQSVDTSPRPQVVVPTSSSHSATSGASGASGTSSTPSPSRLPGSDDPATHDVNDDHGGTTSGRGTDDPATHDVHDDHGGGTSGHGSDDTGSGHGGRGRG
jgi:hypothetical protein